MVERNENRTVVVVNNNHKKTEVASESQVSGTVRLNAKRTAYSLQRPMTL